MLSRVSWMQPSLPPLETEVQVGDVEGEQWGDHQNVSGESVLSSLYPPVAEKTTSICPEPSLLRAVQSQLPQPLLIHHVLQTSQWTPAGLFPACLYAFPVWGSSRLALDTEWRSQKKEIHHFS